VISEPIWPIHCIQLGVYVVEKTLDVLALIGTRVFFQALSRSCFCVSSVAMLVIEGAGS
jgi:hypothetical protein